MKGIFDWFQNNLHDTILKNVLKWPNIIDIFSDDSGYSFSTGLSDPEPDRVVDEDSDVYFNSVENEDDDVVGAGERSDSYSAVDAGK